MMKRAGNILPRQDGVVNQDATSAGTIRTITNTHQDPFTNVLVVAHSSEQRQEPYLKAVKFPCRIGSLQ